MRGKRAWAVLAVTLMLSACGPNAGALDKTLTPGASASYSPPPASPVPGNVSPDAQAAVAAALQDAAAHLGVSQANLRVEKVESHEWADSSLGCPRQGFMYSQIVTPGFLITISNGARQLEYHTDTGSHVVLCKET